MSDIRIPPGFTLTDEQVERERERAEQIVESKQAAGIKTEESVQADYFGFDETHRVMLPDGISWVDHRTLTEGARRKYLNQQNREVKVQKHTGDAIMKMATGDERYTLLMTAIVGWNLVSKNAPIGFNDQNLRKFLESASPKVVDLIEKDVRKSNPWLIADVSIEDIDRQIEELQETRANLVAAQEGEAVS